MLEGMDEAEQFEELGRLFQRYGYLADPYEMLISVTEGLTFAKWEMAVELIDHKTRGMLRTRFVISDFVASAPLADKKVREVIMSLTKELDRRNCAGKDHEEARMWHASRGRRWVMYEPTLKVALVDEWEAAMKPKPPKAKIIFHTTSGPVEAEAKNVTVHPPEDPNMPISRGTIPIKKSPKIPECPVHDSPLVFDAARGLWHCELLKDGKKCKVTARPKQEGRDGRLVLGKGQLDLQMVLPEDEGGEPRIVLVSADNVALDITELVGPKNVELDSAVKRKALRLIKGIDKPDGSITRVSGRVNWAAKLTFEVDTVSLVHTKDAGGA